MSGPLLSVHNLFTWFATPNGVVRAVDGVSFALDAASSMGIVGESGSGKSVLSRSIMNLLPSTNVYRNDGEVIFAGVDVRAPRPGEATIWGRQIAMVFQNPMTSLNPVRRIGVQLADTLTVHLDMNRRQARARSLELLREVGIAEPQRRLDQYPHELSGGMRQRVMIAIAISCNPRLLIVDEPTTALDVIVQKQILDLLARLREEHGMAMILISHDLDVVREYTDHVAVMYAGRFVEEGATDRLFSHVRHPYTRALMQSIPRLDLPSHTPLAAIGGRPPVVIGERLGCSFAPRCPRRTDECERDDPDVTLDGDQRYRCLHPLGEPQADSAPPLLTSTGR